MTALTEELHTGGFMVSEADGHRSRESIIVISGAGKVVAGTVLGLVSVSAGAPVYAATGGNTGNFTCSAVVAFAGAKVGAYAIELIDATHFQVFDPNGDLVGEGVMGTQFANQIQFTITAGGTAGVVGDKATITVAANAGAGKYGVFDPTAADGRQSAAGILWKDVDATSADAAGTGIVRDCEVNSSELVWGTNVTTGGQKTAALAQLAANHVIAR